MELGKFIRERRAVSRREFAEKIGTSVSYLSAVERGDRVPSEDMIIKIAVWLPGFDVHPLYDQMLATAGKLTPERACLLEVRSALMGKSEYKNLNRHIYHALYKRIDDVLYGKLDMARKTEVHDETLDTETDRNRRG